MAARLEWVCRQLCPADLGRMLTDGKLTGGAAAGSTDGSQMWRQLISFVLPRGNPLGQPHSTLAAALRTASLEPCSFPAFPDLGACHYTLASRLPSAARPVRPQGQLVTKEGYLTQIDNGGFRLPVLSGLSDADGNALDTAAQSPMPQQSFGGPASAGTTGGSGFGGPQQPPNPHAAHYSAPPPPDTFTTGRNQQPPPQDYGECWRMEVWGRGYLCRDVAEEGESGEGRILWMLSCRLGTHLEYNGTVS